ncbi:hypothetical protein PUNSTDRAFT_115304 [Punctularia strigosozonata HHB-11173 SS5]|uniref:uncharacterized protein n=1 Tax=Punctularia strigosozonata (strain HHB-11173) TaxID=741275 RepID=UPI0004416CD0|nr:uncharacterized protein PUNSTDRAFT_115304 [Punctularia strigosozonata HHB-11173 SS5]EIN06833.1 hypothetical protein PUNSTDRAFT_115304 [Punctularia strigosozonata HHB-11173 SS5]
MPGRKRKQHPSHSGRRRGRDNDSSWNEPGTSDAFDPCLFIQAHEADIVRGPQAWSSAAALELRVVDGATAPGEGLLRWGGEGNERKQHMWDEYGEGDDGVQDAVWVDRFDARLLLDTLPENDGTTTTPTHEASDVLARVGWDDLPSDSEDTFFLGPSEIEDYRREKRRRVLAENHAARMRALLEDEPEAEPEERWLSDEEPEPHQKELMDRTAGHLVGSPNAAQLEMRILANHGADPRFAFLRGRWKRAWALTKAQAGAAKREKEMAMTVQKPNLGGLAGYGSDSDEESEVEDVAAAVAGKSEPDEPAGRANEDGDEAVKEARRARAKEWAEKRRAQKANQAVDPS